MGSVTCARIPSYASDFLLSALEYIFLDPGKLSISWGLLGASVLLEPHRTAALCVQSPPLGSVLGPARPMKRRSELHSSLTSRVRTVCIVSAVSKSVDPYSKVLDTKSRHESQGHQGDVLVSQVLEQHPNFLAFDPKRLTAKYVDGGQTATRGKITLRHKPPCRKPTAIPASSGPERVAHFVHLTSPWQARLATIL
jgi:hypothetical protein